MFFIIQSNRDSEIFLMTQIYLELRYEKKNYVQIQRQKHKQTFSKNVIITTSIYLINASKFNENN